MADPPRAGESARWLRFHLQIFTDISIEKAIAYWTKELDICKEQLYKPTVTESGKVGSYRKKNAYGVLTVYYGNIKARNILIGILEDMHVNKVA